MKTRYFSIHIISMICSIQLFFYGLNISNSNTMFLSGVIFSINVFAAMMAVNEKEVSS